MSADNDRVSGHGFDAAAIDALGEERLRALASFKWSAFPDCIGAFVAEMDFGTAPAVTAALQNLVDHQQHGYLSRSQTDDLAQACAQWQREHYDWPVAPEWVQAVPDVLSALESVLRYWLPAGTPVVLPTPAYMPFLPMLTLLGHPVRQVPMRRSGDRWTFDFEALARAYADGAGLVILTNPHNPLGCVHTRGELTEFAELAGRHGLRVFADEVHAPLVYSGHRHIPYASVSDQAADHAFTAVSASKAWNLAGLKCAQLILTNAGDRQRWQQVAFLAGHGTGTAGVVANTAAWRHGGDWLSQVIDYLDGNRRMLGQLIAERLPQIDWISPEGTYLAWLDCRPLNLPVAPSRFFRSQARVALTDGADCGEAGIGYARLNFAMPRPLLRIAVERMVGALESLSH